MSRRARALLVSFAVLAVLLVGMAVGARALFDRRADAFGARCDSTVGSTAAEAMAKFPEFYVGESYVGVERELFVSYQYSIAGEANCRMVLKGGRVTRATFARSNRFDRCTDPVSYPRRHWLCSVARILVP